MKRRRSQAGASVDEKTPDSILATEPQTSTSGARLDQGGKTQGPTVPSQDGMQPRKRKRRGSGKGKQSAKTSEVIARLHTLRKQAAATEDPRERKRLEAEEAALGGLSAYQDASITGGEKGGETSKWLVKTLISFLPSNRHQLKSQRLLDVGAVAGSAYAKWPFFKVTSIDINPRADSVLKFDWLEFTPGAVDMSDHVFDLLALSLVLNFQGDLPKRAEMILHAHRFLKPDGKIYIVLPLACMANSRYLTHQHFTKMLSSFGFGTLLKQHDSAKLSYWLLQRDGPDAGWDGTEFKKKEIRSGVKRNNFAITMKA